MKFKLVSSFKPTGDQPEAIDKLTFGVKSNKKNQVLLGVTGSGKTFTMANVIANVGKPTLVMSHNKTLAAQLYREFKEFFPDNAVSYFVSYYDYYQPEAYISQTDTYIEKETDINDQIDKLRLAATTSLLTRNDVIVVASVSSIYNLGSPKTALKFMLCLKVGDAVNREDVLGKLVDLAYERNEYDLKRGTFSAKGEFLRIYLSYEDFIVQIEIINDVVKKITKVEAVSNEKVSEPDEIYIYPAKHYLVDLPTYKNALSKIRIDLTKQVKKLKSCGRELEAYRLEKRVNYDLDMIIQIGYVKGIENYSRYFDGRKPGEPPYTLLDYYPKDKNWLLFIDESHMTIPQIRGMYEGDKTRKKTLIEYGFRLPAASDNRPLNFSEFLYQIPKTIYVSATPNSWEIKQSKSRVIEQLIRPTGIPDPKIRVRSAHGQVKDLITEIAKRVRLNQRVLVTTLTKKMSEALSSYLSEKEEEIRVKFKLDRVIKVNYLHSGVETLERVDILDKLRLGDYDVLIGINLLREGLDLPEVTLVAILDADKEGFLRSETSLIQTMGRAARNIDSEVILYADSITGSIKRAITEVKRRRNIQYNYNKKYGIIPRSIKKPFSKQIVEKDKPIKKDVDFDVNLDDLTPYDKRKLIKRLTRLMNQAAKLLDFEKAAKIRDFIRLVEASF